MSSEERKRELMEELFRLDDLIRGSLVRSTKKDDKASDARAAGGAEHPICQLSTSTMYVRNRITYTNKENEVKVLVGIAVYRYAREIIRGVQRPECDRLEKIRRNRRQASRQRGVTSWSYGISGTGLPH